MRLDRIRNFSIIAHIDHGKSTLADRLLEATGTVALRDMQDQVLDQLDLERERGITIKAQAVRLAYTASDKITYELNLIDTPGHVDFAYEVSRSLAACEGALLVVDATQGVEAQTLANVYQAIDNHLEVIPVINKIDLANADAELVRREIEEVIGIPADDAILTSARQGIGIDLVLEAIVKRVPPPKGDRDGPLRALIFDAKYDAYRGVVVYVRIVDGRVASGMRIRMMNNKSEFVVDEVGVFAPAMTPVDELLCGEVGYFIASIKNVRDSKVGDTVTDAAHPTTHPLPGIPRGDADGLRGHLPGRLRRRDRPQGGVAAPQPQRRVTHLRTGIVSSAGLRVSLRVSWGCCTWRSCRSAWNASSTSR